MQWYSDGPWRPAFFDSGPEPAFDKPVTAPFEVCKVPVDLR